MKALPDDVKLSREEGQALIERLQANTLTGEDRGLLVRLIQLYFWFTCALRETQISLGRLKRALFGEGQRPPPPPTAGGEAVAGADASATAAGDAPPAAERAASVENPAAPPARRPGHGRRGADAYPGAARVVCRHETLAAGQRCPACGRGTLYPLPAGVEIRIDGNALLSAVRYELAKLRCSACGAVFTAPAPDGAEKYSPRAKAVIALGRYSLGLPFYRLEQYQALVGVPVADATQWELAEQVADCAYPVFAQLEQLAAQGEVIFQDDTHVRILALRAENRRADATGETLDRRGMYTTGLVAQVGERVICLYYSGRAHAGDNLSALLARREAGRDPPIVMSDALAANQRDDDDTLIRCHCLAHGRRQFTDLEEVFPVESHHVITVLNHVFEHEAVTRARAVGGRTTGLPPGPQRPAAGGPTRGAGAAVPGPHGGTQQQPGPGVRVPVKALGDPDPISPDSGRAPRQQHGGAGFKAVHPPTKKQSVLRHRARRLRRQPPDQSDRHLRAGRRQRAGLSGGPATPSPRRLPATGGVAAMELSGEPGARRGGPGPGLGHRAPVGGHGSPVGAAVPEQHLQLAGHQRDGGAVRARPPLEPTLREALGTQPEPLAVVTQQFEGSAGAVAEHVDRPIQRIAREVPPADGSQPIDPVAKIHRRQGQ